MRLRPAKTAERIEVLFVEPRGGWECGKCLSFGKYGKLHSIRPSPKYFDFRYYYPLTLGTDKK